MTKRVGLLAVFAILLGSAVPAQDSKPAESQVAESQPAAAEKTAAAFAGPALVTDVGQGNSARLVQVMLKRDGTVEFTADDQAGADALEGVGTLVVGVGASTKGLGAAGLDAETELARGKALLAAAKEKGVGVIGVHIGGAARRGELSDKFVEEVFRASDAFVAWKGGNEDGFLTKLAEETGIRYIEVEGKTDVGAELVGLFGGN